jgi:inner membrane protein
MPLPVAHGLMGASIVAAIYPQRRARRLFIALLVGAFVANAADLDFLLVFALHSKAWHRGFSHSIIFALLVCLLFALSVGKRYVKEALAYGLAFASHGVLDYLTTKEGGGVELLWPFSTERLVPGWWGLSELPSRLPLTGILKALVLEFVIFTPLLLVVLLLRKIAAKHSDATTGAT